jgi:predicted porin
LEKIEMKKTLVAIAALAVVGAASAQSSVTLYGRIDASIGSQRTTNNGNVAGATVDAGTQILAGAHTGNRWGMKGSEDLGGGLKAIFQLENGFSVDTGAAAQGGLLFGRQAYVGLTGGFGSLTVGRQYDLLDVAYGAYDAMGYSGYSSMGYAFNKGTGGDIIGRQNNAVIYSSPSMGGFTGSLAWAPGENKTAAVSAGNMYGLMAQYANGPIGVGAAWQSNKAAGNVSAVTNYLIGGSYDLGAAKLYGQYEGTNNKPANSKDNGWSLGAVIPLGAPSLMVSYARENAKVAGNKVSDSTAFSLMVQYPLSKRTYVYAAYLNGEIDPVAAGVSTQKNRNFGLGLVHNF